MPTDAKTTKRPATRKPAGDTAQPAAPKPRARAVPPEPGAAELAAARPRARRKPAQSAPVEPAPRARGRVARPLPSAEERHRMICLAAYYRAERRGFAAGYELQDWLAAEAEVDSLLGLAPSRGQ